MESREPEPFGTANVMVVAGMEGGSPEHIGLILTPDGKAICGTVIGTPASDHDLDWHARKVGLPVDWDAHKRMLLLGASVLTNTYGVGKESS